MQFSWKFQLEMPWGKIVTWMQVLNKNILRWKCFLIDIEIMKEKDVKEKLHFKKDENGKRFLYISMGRFQTEIFCLFRWKLVGNFWMKLNRVKRTSLRWRKDGYKIMWSGNGWDLLHWRWGHFRWSTISYGPYVPTSGTYELRMSHPEQDSRQYAGHFMLWWRFTLMFKIESFKNSRNSKTKQNLLVNIFPNMIITKAPIFSFPYVFFKKIFKIQGLI